MRARADGDWAAKRLKAGKATGVDVWDATVLSGNSSDAAKANAKLEGVAERVRFETGDIRKLAYPERAMTWRSRLRRSIILAIATIGIKLCANCGGY